MRAVQLLCLAVAMLTALPLRTSRAGMGCPDGEVLSPRLITDICWSCLFPIRIAGVPLGGGDMPSGAADPVPLCFCVDEDETNFGTQLSMWEPARLVEVVRVPYCVPSFGGMRLQDDFVGTGGPHRKPGTQERMSTYYYHILSFNLLYMLELFMELRCTNDGYPDLDLVQVAEMIPYHNDDELAGFVSPEIIVASNPLAQAACVADALKTSGGLEPIDPMYWCAGSLGSMYPITGNITAQDSPPKESSLIAARAQHGMHRYGFSRKTMGNGAMCGPSFYPMMPKSMYRWSMFYPLAEASSNHPTGQTPFMWGEHRNIPATGEDFIYIIWRWFDCCMRWL